MPAPDPTPQPTDPPPLGATGGAVRLAPGVSVPAGVLDYSYTAASGPGGQNVNKVATRCVLRVRIADLPLKPWQAERLAALEPHLVTARVELLISGDKHRSQTRNREACLERLGELIMRAMVRPKVRRATKPTRGSRERRLKEKKHRGDVKKGRQGDHG
jgi:ribosome-associated protein